MKEGKKRGRGRPMVRPEDRRDVARAVAFSVTEWDLVVAAAEREGILPTTGVREAALAWAQDVATRETD